MGSRISQIASRSLSVAGWMAKQASLLLADELFKFRFGEDGYAEFLSLIVLRPRVDADYNIVSFLADGAAELATVLLDEFPGFFAAAAFERAGEHERFAREFLAFDFTFFGGGSDSRGVKLLNQLTVGRFTEKFHDAFADLGTNLGDPFQIFRFCFFQLL